MPSFDFNQWVFLIASAIAFVAGLSWQVRVQRRRQKLVKQELSRLHCSQCGGTFEPWRGAMSLTQYLQLDEYHVPFVLDVVCSSCGIHYGMMLATCSSNRPGIQPVAILNLQLDRAVFETGHRLVRANTANAHGRASCTT